MAAFSYGCADTITRNALYSIPPFASFLVTQNCKNKTLVNFKDRSILDIEHRYNFGDGESDTTKNPIHKYATPGLYKAYLYTHNNTCHDTSSEPINVIDEKGNISLPNDTFCTNNSITADIDGINLNNVKQAQ